MMALYWSSQVYSFLKVGQFWVCVLKATCKLIAPVFPLGFRKLQVPEPASYGVANKNWPWVVGWGGTYAYLQNSPEPPSGQEGSFLKQEHEVGKGK